MDPKLLQAAGIDPKILGLDAKTPAAAQASASADLKPLFGMDAKALQAAGIDPKLLQGLDPKALASLDPKMMAGLAGMDPKLLFGGMDPKLFGFDPKMFGLPDSKGSSKASSVPPRLAPTDKHGHAETHIEARMHTPTYSAAH